MNYLFYNPIEFPNMIRIKSSCFGIDVEYEPLDINNKKPTKIEELFILSKSSSFESVEVLLTTNNEAYEKNNKKALVGTRIKGWVDLKKYKDGGGYLDDYVAQLKDKEE